MGFPLIDWRRTSGQPLSCEHLMTTNPQPRIYVTFTTGVKAWIVNKSDVDAVDSHVYHPTYHTIKTVLPFHSSSQDAIYI